MHSSEPRRAVRSQNLLAVMVTIEKTFMALNVGSEPCSRCHSQVEVDHKAQVERASFLGQPNDTSSDLHGLLSSRRFCDSFLQMQPG